MEWDRAGSVQEIIDVSNKKPVLIFKHSPRCGISRNALDRIERNWNSGDHQAIKCVYVHVIDERKLSNEIAEYFNVRHESPQVLVVKNGKCVYYASHDNVTCEGLLSSLQRIF